MIFYDTFQAPRSTESLGPEADTPDVGSARWSKLVPTSAYTILPSISPTWYGVLANPLAFYSTGNTGVADCLITVNGALYSTAGTIGVLGRLAGSDNCILAMLGGTIPRISLFAVVAGVPTALAPALAWVPDTNLHELKLALSGQEIRFYVDGALKLSGSSALNPGGTAHGFSLYSQNDRITNFKVETFPKWATFEGDSLTWGYTAGGRLAPTYPELAMGLFATDLGFANNAVSGSKVADLTARAAAADAILPRSKAILCVLVGRNDLAYLPDAPTFVANLKAYCLARRTAGWKVVVATLLPSTHAGFNTVRNAANTLIKADASFYDALADVGADSIMGPDAAASSVDLYADGSHPTQMGATLLALVFSAAITAI